MLWFSVSILRILHSISCADEAADVAGLADVHLRGGQEDRHADIDQQTALDPAADHALDDVAFFVVGDDDVPSRGCGRPCVCSAGCRFRRPSLRAGLRSPCRRRSRPGLSNSDGLDDAFALETKLDDHVVADLRDDRALDNRAGNQRFDLCFQYLCPEQLLVFSGEQGVEFPVRFARRTTPVC